MNKLFRIAYKIQSFIKLFNYLRQWKFILKIKKK